MHGRPPSRSGRNVSPRQRRRLDRDDIGHRIPPTLVDRLDPNAVVRIARGRGAGSVRGRDGRNGPVISFTFGVMPADGTRFDTIASGRGTRLVTIDLPRPFRVDEIGPDWVFGIRTTADDVKLVRRYPPIKPAGPS